MPSLQFVQVLITALLPLFSTIVAGAARQDRAPAWLNDFISFVTPLGAGVLNTVASGAQANGSGLAFLAISTLFANLSHAPFLYNIQQELQSRLLSFGVKSAQLQAVEHDLTNMAPQLAQSLDNLSTLVGSHSGAIGKLATMLDAHMGALREIVGYIRQANAAANAVPASQIPPQNIVSVTPPIATAQAASVPQQPFPAQGLHWQGDTGAVPVAQK